MPLLRPTRRTLRAALGAAVLCLAAAARPVAAQELGLPVGTAAPAAAVQTLDGQPTDLARYVGKTPVLIEFWASWCPNCKALEPQLQRIARTQGARIKLIGVAVSVNQTPQRAKLYAAKYKLPMELLWDAQGKASEAYDAPATSYVVIVDRTGKVVYTGQGADQKLEDAVQKALR